MAEAGGFHKSEVKESPMFHGLTHEAIYAAARTTATFIGSDGSEKQGTGTAFGINVEGTTVLVTNRHMVDLNFGRTDGKYVGYKLEHLVCETRARDAADGTPGAVRSLHVPMSHNEILFDPNPLNDVAVIFDIQTANLDGSDDREWGYSFNLGDVATDEELRNDLHPFDFLAIPGFPDGFDKAGMRAIIRAGTIACDPRFEYSFASQDKGEILVFDGFSFSGSSGSPVIAVPKVPPTNIDPQPGNHFRRLLLVGVNAGHITTAAMQHAGLSYFVRSSVIRRIIDARRAGQ
ncbi:hypothetical protein [Paraburkholderia terricola]|uniref:hypothetical protein n=1 Tax=Paraburkholderia terricola TaxID=169427 RepID=UPI003ECE148F